MGNCTRRKRDRFLVKLQKGYRQMHTGLFSATGMNWRHRLHLTDDPLRLVNGDPPDR